MRPKLFRDPVHDIISFDLDDPVDKLVYDLVLTPTFQRLRRIRQLGFAHLVYHGAEHSRFQHSVGVAHVARRILATLEVHEPLDRVEVLAAAMLHDIGHGPFSHAIEKVTGIHHEALTRAMIDDPTSDVHAVLASFDPRLPARVSAYFGPRQEFPRERHVFLDIVSSQLDADRLDYILRDGLATGVKIGLYDFERIHALFRTYRGVNAQGEETLRLAVSARAKEAVEGYLIARFHMFKQVYLHRTVRSAEKMLEATLRRAGQLLDEGHEFSRPVDPTLAKLLQGKTLSIPEFISLDDTDIWVALKHWSKDSDDVLVTLAGGLLNRKLYKTITLDPNDPVGIARAYDQAQQIARKLGLNPDYAVLLDRASDTPYRPYDPASEATPSHIPIIERDGRVVPIEQVSDLVHLLGRDAYKIIHLCVTDAVRKELEAYLTRVKG